MYVFRAFLAMSDDGYDGGAGGDDYDYGGPGFGEDAFVRLFPLLPASSSHLLS